MPPRLLENIVADGNVLGRQAGGVYKNAFVRALAAGFVPENNGIAASAMVQ